MCGLIEGDFPGRAVMLRHAGTWIGPSGSEAHDDAFAADGLRPGITAR